MRLSGESIKNEAQEQEEGYTEVFAWGADRNGQLGLGNKQGGRCYCIPRFCTFNVVIRKVSCGEEHSAFITSNGNIFAMGSNMDGRLGIGDRSVKLSSTPCLVEALSKLNASGVTCGWGHTAAVMDNGDLYTWGVGEYGALGITDCESQWFPVKVAFPESGQVYVRSVACGTRHTAIVDDKGRLFVCGAGDAGQLGTGSREKEVLPFYVSSVKGKVVQTACGIFHTLVLTETGSVLAMGGNNFGQLGTGSKRSSTVPVFVKGLNGEQVVKIAAGHFSAALSARGTVYVWGTGVFGEYLVPTVLGGLEMRIEDVTVGGCFGGAIDPAGGVYTWGANSSGELGVGDYLPRVQPEPIRALLGKCVTQLSCGGSYAIALGQTIPHSFSVVPKSRRVSAAISTSTPNIVPGSGVSHALGPGMQVEGGAVAAAIAQLGPGSMGPMSPTKLAAPTSSLPKSIPSSVPAPAPAPRPVSVSVPVEGQVSALAGGGGGKKEAQGNEYVPRKARLNEELLEAYKSEQQACKELGRRLEELEREVKEGQTRAREREMKEQQRAQVLEQRARERLEAERAKTQDLNKRLEVEKGRDAALEQQSAALEGKAVGLEAEVGTVRKDNQRLREEKLAQNADESTRLSELLKVYEDKIEREIAEKHDIIKQKTHDINGLHDEISKLENAITAMQGDRLDLAAKYTNEIERLEAVLEDAKQELVRKQEAKGHKLAQQARDAGTIHASQLQVQEATATIAELRRQLDSSARAIADHKNEAKHKDGETAALRQRREEQERMLEAQNGELARLAKEGKRQEAHNRDEAEHGNTALAELGRQGEDLQDRLNVKQAEIDTLHKDVAAWNDVAERIREENAALKHRIEELEQKNKKLLEGMNLHLYNRAAEYKDRTIKALTTSQAAQKRLRGAASTQKLKYPLPSPLRLERFLEEEKKTTQSGVAQTSLLTQFAADTAANIKAAGNFDSEGCPTFDGKFILDQEDHHIVEDPQYVKSNYHLVTMLDSYDKPRQTPLDPKPGPESAQSRAVLATPQARPPPDPQIQTQMPVATGPVDARHLQIVASTQQLLRVLGSEPHSREFMTPAPAKARLLEKERAKEKEKVDKKVEMCRRLCLFSNRLR